MAEVFTRLTSGHGIAPVQVTVAGRQIKFDDVANNIAKVSFDQICGAALAARDYLALADRYSGLFDLRYPAIER